MSMIITSNIKHKDFRFRPSVRPSRLYYLPLDCETGWTGELWLKNNLHKWQNNVNIFFFFFFFVRNNIIIKNLIFLSTFFLQKYEIFENIYLPPPQKNATLLVLPFEEISRQPELSSPPCFIIQGGDP